MKKFLLFLTLSFLLCSCGDIIEYAKDKAYFLIDSPFDLIPLNFKAVEGSDNRKVILTWDNPVAENFYGVKLIRKAGSQPLNNGSSDETVIYQGTNEKYFDSELAPDKTYYYAIYGKSTDGKYSEANYTTKQITETELDIRRRSFFIIGGSSSHSDPTGNLITGVDMFDPVTESTTSLSVDPLPNPRVFCDIAYVNGKIYVFGGKDGSGVVSAVDVLDVATLTWDSTPTITMVSPRVALRTLVFNAKVYCLGGSTTTLASGANASNYIYDPSQNSWLNDTSVLRDLTSPRCAFGAVSYYGNIYYFGGTTGTWQNSGRSYNIVLNQEITLAGLLYYNGMTPALYHKDFADGDDLTIFFTFGGSQDNSPAQVDLPVDDEIYLTYKYVFAAFIPNTSGVEPYGYRIFSSSIESYTNTMYAECEYYGDYVYYFGGVIGNDTTASVIADIQKLDVNDGILSNATWSTADSTLTTARYGFGMTRVNE